MNQTPLAEVELRMSIPPIETLLADRHALVQEIAPLRARHGSFGTYADLRKIELAKVAAIIRAEAVAAPRKMTEASIEESAHSDPRYTEFVIAATEEKARYFMLEDQIGAIDDLIQRGNAVSRYLAQEVALAR